MCLRKRRSGENKYYKNMHYITNTLGYLLRLASVRSSAETLCVFTTEIYWKLQEFVSLHNTTILKHPSLFNTTDSHSESNTLYSRTVGSSYIDNSPLFR